MQISPQFPSKIALSIELPGANFDFDNSGTFKRRLHNQYLIVALVDLQHYTIDMKIVLFGDSIRLPNSGYGRLVEERLTKNGHVVFQPTDNCRFSKNLLRMIHDLKEEIKDADIIHFNVGHWDHTIIFEDGKPFTPIEEYENNLRRIVYLLKRITPNIIFATTTPTRATDNTNQRIEKYNEVAIQIMKEENVEINDLYHLVLPQLDICISDDRVHPTEKGKEIMGEQVIRYIEEKINCLNIKNK